jgi:type III pantothenate kinase
MSAEGLFNKTHALPRVKLQHPESALGKTTVEHIQSGIYFGMLGAIERIVDELRQEHPSPSSMMVLATGGMTRDKELEQDLLDFVDIVDPYLTLIGLKEILKE